METPKHITEMMKMPASNEHKKNVQKFANEFLEGYRVIAYLPDVSKEINKKLATLLVVTAILINKKIEDTDNTDLLSTWQFIDQAQKIVNYDTDWLDCLCTYKAIDTIIEGRQYFNDNTGVRLFLAREDIKGLTTVKLIKYE